MKHSPVFMLIILLLIAGPIEAQQKNKPQPKSGIRRSDDRSNELVVIDERLSVFRNEPGFAGTPIRRIQTGKTVIFAGFQDLDGIRFYRVQLKPRTFGWIQSDALVSNKIKGDDVRLARLIQASDGFEQLERIVVFLKLFHKSALRPAILLMFGDIAELTAEKLSNDAKRRLSDREMYSSGAARHSFFLNFVSLDRYRKLGISFVLNSQERRFHYNGEAWREIIRQHKDSIEAPEAQLRLEALKSKMETKTSSLPTNERN
jgi:hypothetical protein